MQGEINMANQTQDLEQGAKEVLHVIERQGLDWVRSSPAHGLHLSYGIENNLFDQSVVDGAQTRYEASHKK